MIALDTNVLVRLLVGDDQDQLGRATRLMSSKQTILLVTVLLELEWVLRKVYRYTVSDITDAVQKLIALKNLHVPDRDVVEMALAAYAKGMDLADALHLAQVSPHNVFVSFDKQLKAHAKRVGGFVPVVAP